MNLAHLKYVVATAELKSFSRAAQRCHVTQSTLSNGVAEIEDELGAKLFERTTRNVSLSPFGEVMLPLINSVLSAEANLASQASNYLNPRKALIKIGVSPLLNPAFTSLLTQSFRDQNPSFEIVLFEENLEQLQKMLIANKLDFIFVPHVAEFQKMTSLCLYDELLVLVAQGSKVPSSNSVSTKSLKGQKFVMVPDTCGLASVTRDIFKKAKVPLDEYEGKAFSYSALTDWAQSGIGSAVLPRSKVTQDTQALALTDSSNSPERIRFVAIGSTSSRVRFKAFTDHIKNTAGRLSQQLALEHSCMAG
jgi:DNA-binding transcriptional LysR family regulator